MSCECQSCGKQYRVDLIIPDDLWEEKIKPKNSSTWGGMLCGACIMQKLEKLKLYSSYYMTNKNTYSLDLENEKLISELAEKQEKSFYCLVNEILTKSLSK